MDNYQGKDIPEWSKMSKQDYREKLEKLTSRKWSASMWEQITHELVWVIGLLEENPTSPKVWRKVFNTLKVYENLERNNKEK